MKQIIFILSLFITSLVMSQVILLDPGHGYRNGQCENRPALECATNLAVGLFTKNEFNTRCPNGAAVHLTRWTDPEIGYNNSNSLRRRTEMSNNLRADRYLSIHCNGGGGTGTESFYCYMPDNNSGPDRDFATIVQREMVTQGEWYNRRTVEDRSFMPYHFWVLKASWATSTLSEIGFVDRASDRVKLESSTWRKRFAKAYFDALKTNLRLTCSSTASAPGAFRLTVTAECDGTNNYNKLTWQTSSNASSYKIYRNGALYTTVTGTSFNNYWITTGTNYTYKVVAVNSVGSTQNNNGNVSAIARNCTSTNLGAFTLSVSARCGGSNNYNLLTWTPSANATSYRIYRNGTLYTTVTTTSYANWWSINPGSSYTYKVVAVNNTGTRENSNGGVTVTAAACRGTEPTTYASIKEIGIGDYFTHSKLTISPNPASDYVNMKFEGALEGDVNVEIYDINGVNVLSENFKNKKEIFENKLDVSKLKPGHYTLRLIHYDNSFVEHFLKK